MSETKVTITPKAANSGATDGTPGAGLVRAPSPPKPMPSLGESVAVMAPLGTRLRNNETGGFFEPGVATPQTVTVTTLKRLADGDLVRV